MKIIQELEELLRELHAEVAKNHAEKNLANPKIEIVDLNQYVKFKLLLTKAWLEIGHGLDRDLKLRLDEIDRASDQLDRAMTGAETLRYRAKYH